MEIGMAVKDGGAFLREEGDQRIVNLALQAVLQRNRQRKIEFWKRVRVAFFFNMSRWKMWHRCKSGRKELMAEGQWQEREQRAKGLW